MKFFRGRIHKGAIVASLLMFSYQAWGQVYDSGLSHLILPVVVNSSTYQSEIYLTTASGGGDKTASVKYLGGNDSATPGTVDCGTLTIPSREVVKKNLVQLCPSLNAGSNYGTLLINTLGATGGAVPSLRAYSRVQNSQGIGFSIDAYAPKSIDFSGYSNGGRVIGTKNGTDSNGITYQTNCFVGMYPGASPSPSTPPTAQSVTIVARDKFDTERGRTTISVPPGSLTRILDVFKAVGISPGTYLDSVSIEFTQALYEPTPRGAFGFCTVQNNNNFSADFRMPGESRPTYRFGEDLDNYDLINTHSFTLSTGQTARYIGFVDGTGAFQCFVSDEQLRLKVRGFEAVDGAPDWLTPRLEFTQAYRAPYYGDTHSYYGYLDIEITLANGVSWPITASLTCNVSHGIYGLLRLY